MINVEEFWDILFDISDERMQQFIDLLTFEERKNCENI